MKQNNELIDKRYWDDSKARWDGHRAFNTISHQHVSHYPSDPQIPYCDIMIVECSDGRWYVEDGFGGDAKGAEKVWNPFIYSATPPHFFKSEEDARKHATSVVMEICSAL